MEKITLISPNSSRTLMVESDETIRLDRFLPRHFTGYSRSFFQKLIDQACVKLNGQVVTKNGISLKQGDLLDIHFPSHEKKSSQKVMPDNLSIDIIFEHEHFLVISKPASLMVHRPTATSSVFTLVDWLNVQRSEFNSFENPDRPGIVHRLDKDTSGLMIIARNPYAQAVLSDLFKKRAISKTYLAVVEGITPASGTIDFHINRDPLMPTKMTHRYAAGREALTYYQAQQYFGNATLVEARPVTGRTHQLRVHFAGLRHPIMGDVVYGKVSKLIKRQALHAWKLSFSFEGKDYSFQQEPPTDFQALIKNLS